MSQLASPQGPEKRYITFFGPINAPNSKSSACLGGVVNEGPKRWSFACKSWRLN